MKRLLKRLSFLLCITPTITFADCIDVPYLGTYCSPPNGGIINAPYLGPQCGYGQCIQVPYLGVQCSNVSGGGTDITYIHLANNKRKALATKILIPFPWQKSRSTKSYIIKDVG